jgi:hypothetical protein
MNTRAVMATVLVCAFRPLAAQHANAPSAVATVAQLYKEFAWEAVVSTPDSEWRRAVGLVDQPRTVLRRYFDDRLAGLWLADRTCVRRTHGECHLSFMPMWDSQDPTATGLRVLATKDSSVVTVRFWRPGDRESVELTYRLTMTADGWRISDISSGSRWSLVALLSGRN